MRMILCTLLVLLMAACSNKDGREDDDILPTVILVSPTNGQQFTAGATVPITGTITDNNSLAEVHVHISNAANNQLLIDIHRYPGAATYALNESFQAQAGINYQVRIIAVDKSGNQALQTVQILVN